MLTVYRRHRPDCRHIRPRAGTSCAARAPLVRRRTRRPPLPPLAGHHRSGRGAGAPAAAGIGGYRSARRAGAIGVGPRAGLSCRRPRPAAQASHHRQGRGLFRDMSRFAEQRQARQLSRWTPALARDFRESWRWSRLAAVKQLERLKTVFRFAVEQGWLASRPGRRPQAAAGGADAHAALLRRGDAPDPGRLRPLPGKAAAAGPGAADALQRPAADHGRGDAGLATGSATAS